MGAENSKDAAGKASIPPAIHRSFARIAQIDEAQLKLSSAIDGDRLSAYLEHAGLPYTVHCAFMLYCVDYGKSTEHTKKVNRTGRRVTLQSYARTVAQFLEGEATDRAKLLIGDAEEIERSTVTETIHSLFDLCMKMCCESESGSSWPKCMTEGDSKQLIHSVVQSLDDSVNLSALEQWLHSNAVVDVLLRHALMSALFLLDVHSTENHPISVPQCLSDTNYELMNWTVLIGLNSYLVPQYKHKWNLLYASRAHGASFLTMLKRVAGQGPSLALVRDTDGHVFGAFASDGFHVGPKFTDVDPSTKLHNIAGDDSCLVFSVTPKYTVHTSTGFNQQFAYCNVNQQSMPNGLGVGGSIEGTNAYFAFWLSSDYGYGHSIANISSFKNNQLSKVKEFRYEQLEVWSLAERQLTEIEQEQVLCGKSILDKADAETKAILEMTGHTQHSAGLRQPETD